MVRTHPVTGKKALYVNRGFTRCLVGVPRDESDGILSYLYQHMENPLFQCRFRWQRELDRLLGQPLRPAPRHVGLLAPHPQRQPRDRRGRQAVLMPSPSPPPPSDGRRGEEWNAKEQPMCLSSSIATACWSTVSRFPTPVFPAR